MSRDRHGFAAADSILALMVLSAMIVLLTVAITRQQRASEALAGTRRATVAAQEALDDLRLGRPVGDPSAVAVEAADSPSSPRGWRWVRVQATVDSRSASLLGLVPATRPATQPASEGGRP